MSTGQNITRYRHKAKLTQAQLAKMAGISESYLRAIEAGRRQPHLKTLAKIAKHLDVSMEILITGKKISEKRD